MLMKNNFQSKSVPRGTRTIWRYLGALFILFTFAIGNVWGINYYTPTADEVIVLKDNTSHACITSLPTSTSTDYKCGDPENGGAQQSTASTTYCVKGNSGKVFKIAVAGCSEVVVYHNNHNSRHIKTTLTPSVGDATTQEGTNGTLTTSITLDGAKSYELWIQGWGTSASDLYVYAIKLKKASGSTQTAPAITNPSSTPDLAEITAGETKQFSVTATGNPAPTYQWYSCDDAEKTNPSSIGSATSASYTTANSLAVGTYYYYCVATNSKGSATSPVFSLKVNELGGDLTAHTPGVYTKAADKGGYGQSLVTYQGREYEIIAMVKNNSKNFWFAGTKSSTPSDAHCLSTEGFTTSFTPAKITGAWMKGTFSALGSNTSSSIDEFPAISSYCSAKITTATATSVMIKVQGYDQISFYAKDASSKASDNKHLVVKVNGVEKSMTLNTSYSVRRFTLDPTQTSVVEITGSTASGESHLVGFSLRLPQAEKHHVTYSLNGGTGTAPTQEDVAENGKFTVAAMPSGVTPPTGKEFDKWNDGTTDYAAGAEYTMGTSDVELTAKWKDHVLSDDATLSDLTVGGETVSGFAPATLAYNVELPFGTTAVPAVVGTANSTFAKSVDVTPAASLPGSTTVVVTAENNSTKTYTITFTVADSKDIRMAWNTSNNFCSGAEKYSSAVKSDNALVSAYINKITFTNVEGSGDNGAEGGSLNVGKKAGNMFTLAAKPGYAMKAMQFAAKIQDATCEYSLDGGEWTTLSSTNTGGDACYTVFSDEEVHEFRLRSTGTSGVWIRNMELSIITACTPVKLTWTAEPAAEYEVGKAASAIAATANNGGAVAYSTTATGIVNVAANGALTIAGLGSATLKAATAEGDGTAYCANGGADIVISKAVNTYYLVKLDAQNETDVTEVKYYSGDDAIALPTEPSYSGFVFQGWFDAASAGNAVAFPLTPESSRTIYAQWVAECTGPTINVHPASANYLTGRTASALTCEATAGAAGELTYTWYSCDDAERTNPVVLAGAPTPSTAVAGTFYYYCAVTEAGCDIIRNSNVATITIEDKEPVCIIKSTPTSGNDASVDGYYKGSAFFKGSSAKKLSSGYDYVGVQLMAGKSFLATDKVVLNQAADLGDASDITKFYVFTETPASGKSYATVDNATPQKGDNWFAMPSELVGKSSLYIGRVDAKCNPTLGYLAVYRTMAPELIAIAINERAGVIDPIDPMDGKHFNVLIPYSADLADLSIVKTVAWNAPHATTPAAVISNEGAWIIGDNTYRLMDKDGDYTDYTITLAREAHYEAKIGETGYATLVEAVAAAQNNDVIVLQENVVAGAGIMLTKDDHKTITIDFGGYTYTAVTPGVGSVGTQNQAFHLEKGNTVTLKNGKIACSGSEIKMLIQNYCDLTLENITLDGSGLEGSHRYVMSNNCGDVVIGNGTTITAKEGDVAFDVCATNYYPDGVTVTVKNGASITGIVEYDVWGTKPADNKAELAIEGGNFNITWKVEEALAEDAKENLNVSGGQFSEIVPADYCAEGYAPVTTPNAQGKYEVQDVRVVIFNGITSSSSMATSPSGAISWAKVGDTMGEASKSGTYDEVNYVKALQLKNSSTTKHFKIDVDINNNAKIEVIGMSNDNSETRRAWLTNSTEKGEYANAIAGLESEGYNPAAFATDWLEEGSYYLHADNTVNIFLIRVTPKAVPAKCEVPTITAQPQTNLTFGAGNMTTTVVAEVADGGTLKYQWYNAADDSKVVGATEATLSTPDEGTYYVIVTNTLADHRDNFVKSDEAQLAHRVMNDATLSALSYGTPATAIALEADKYDYRVDLAMGTIDVPELTATATMAPYSVVSITNATEFVNYEATSTVLVTAEDGVTQKTYTVKFVVDHVYTALVDVTESTTWNWTGSVQATINDVENKGLILANYIDGLNFEMIEGKAGEYARRDQNDGVYQGTRLHFKTTVPGKVKFYFRAPSSGENCTITVKNNGKEMVAGTRGNSLGWSKEIVVKGDVEIEMVNDKQGGGTTRVQQIVFTELTPDYTRNVSSNYGTLCVEHNVLVGGAMGATFYQIASRNEIYSDKIDFEEVLPNEELKAGEPYLFKSNTGKIELFYGEETAATPKPVRGMIGNYDATTLEITPDNMSTTYYFANNKLWSCENLVGVGLTLNEHRCYIDFTRVPTYEEYIALQQPNSAPRRRVSLGMNSEKIATGCENLNVSDKPVKMIINGQLFILRGEKMYDAKGQLVK